VHAMKPWRSGGLAPCTIVSPVSDGVGREWGVSELQAGMLLVGFPVMSLE